jgi:hypothetical protein
MLVITTRCIVARMTDNHTLGRIPLVVNDPCEAMRQDRLALALVHHVNDPITSRVLSAHEYQAITVRPEPRKKAPPNSRCK